MNYTFTFALENDYIEAISKGYIEEYEIMRIEIQDENGNITLDYPTHSLEEYIKHIKSLNKNQTISISYSSKHYYDASEYDEDTKDTLLEWHSNSQIGLEYL
jgi:hypothetical protein